MEPDVALHELLRYRPKEIEKRWQELWQLQPPQEIISSELSDLLRVTCLQHNVLKAEKQTFDTTGANRFLQRLWRLARTDNTRIPNLAQRSKLLPVDNQIHKATQKLTRSASRCYETHRYRKLIADCMGFTNLLYRYIKNEDGANQATLCDAINALLRALAPAAPHICAELWSIRHNGKNIFATDKKGKG